MEVRVRPDVALRSHHTRHFSVSPAHERAVNPGNKAVAPTSNPAQSLLSSSGAAMPPSQQPIRARSRKALIIEYGASVTAVVVVSLLRLPLEGFLQGRAPYALY